MSDEIETMIIEKGANVAPRITPGHIDAQIVSEHYFTAANGRDGAIMDGTYSGVERPQNGGVDLLPLKLLTICVLVLKNGFTVTGESACASPENFNAEIGRTISRRAAYAKIGAFEGYQLRTQLAGLKVSP